MATIKVKFRASSVPGKEGTLYYHLIHQRNLRWISTDYHVRTSGTTRSRLSLFLTATTDRRIYSSSSHK